MAVMTKSIGPMVLKALGLPTERCYSLTLTFEPNELVKATAVYLPERQEIETVVMLLGDAAPTHG